MSADLQTGCDGTEIPDQDGRGGTEWLNQFKLPQKSSLQRNRKRQLSIDMSTEVLTTSSAHLHLHTRFMIAQPLPLLDQGSKEAEIGPLQGNGASPRPVHL